MINLLDNQQNTPPQNYNKSHEITFEIVHVKECNSLQ